MVILDKYTIEKINDKLVFYLHGKVAYILDENKITKELIDNNVKFGCETIDKKEMNKIIKKIKENFNFTLDIELKNK